MLYNMVRCIVCLYNIICLYGHNYEMLNNTSTMILILNSIIIYISLIILYYQSRLHFLEDRGGYDAKKWNTESKVDPILNTRTKARACTLYIARWNCVLYSYIIFRLFTFHSYPNDSNTFFNPSSWMGN